MKRIGLFVLLALIGQLLFSQPALQQFLNHPALKHASVGIDVRDIETGRTILSYNAEKSLTPASITKIITTATAMRVLGEDFRYSTRIAIDKDHPDRLLVLGVGDPTLASNAMGNKVDDFFTNAVIALQRALDPHRVYSIYVVDNLFGYEGISPEWTWIDMGNYYAAGAYGISVFDNTYKLIFNTTNTMAPPMILRTEPEIKGLKFQNFLTYNTTGSDNGYIYGVPFSYDRILRGNIPQGKIQFSIKGDIPDPGMMLGETLADRMRQHGFKVNVVETAQMNYIAGKPDSYSVGNVIYTLLSPPLADIIREVNVSSNNHYAEHLIRTIGSINANNIYADALKEGIDAVHKYWSKESIATESLTLYDGSGLAPQNAFSPAFLNDILINMYANVKWRNAFINSLPLAGKEGTVKSFMKNTKYDGKMYVKSGSIGGVQCFSGYIIDGGKRYAFTVMVNKFNGTRPQVRGAIEKLLNAV